MTITVNGDARSVESGTRIRDLLNSLKLEPVRVAVEVNEQLVPRNSFDGTELQNGDRVEIVTFVGGG